MSIPGRDDAASQVGFEVPLDRDSPVSVVIPMFNAGTYIERALRSVAAQTVHPREVIVVDDGSTDSGPELVAGVGGVRLIRQANAGEGSARNAGVPATSTPWIAFLDADDAWFPTHLAAVLRIIRDVPDAGLVATRHEQVPNCLVPETLTLGWRQRIRSGSRIDYFRRAGRHVGVVCSSTAAVRREAFDDVGGFTSERAGADLRMWARIALRHPVGISESLTAVYVRHTGGAMERAASETRVAPAGWVPLQQMTPSIRAVLEEADQRRPDVPLRSIELYVDGRVTSNWRRVLVGGNQIEARRRWRELHHPFHWSAWPFLLAAWLPVPVGRLLAEVRASLITRLRARPR